VGTIIENAATMVWNAISGTSCGTGGTGGGLGGGGSFYGGYDGGGSVNYSPAPNYDQTNVDEQFCPEDCETCCGKGSGGAGSGDGGNSGGFGGFGGSPRPGVTTGVPQGGF